MTLETRISKLEAKLQSLKLADSTRSTPPDKLTFARELLKIDLDPWQGDVVSSEWDRLILNCSRQAGKSTTAGILALYESLYVPDSLTILISPTLRQSSELFRKVTRLKDALPYIPSLLEDNRLSLWVRGGGRIVSLPGSEATVRGFSSATLVIEDEASRVSNDLHMAVRPMLATTKGRYLIMSTPRGKIGHFYDIWEAGEWQRKKVTAYQVPRISKEFLEQERRTMPAHVFAQEFLCEFSEMIDSVFNFSDVQAAITSTIRPLF